MTADRLAEELEQLRETWGEVSTALAAPGQILVRIKEVGLPRDCAPAGTAALLAVQDGQRPQLYVKGGIKLPNGAVPKNYTANQVGGEEWWSFSYSFTWDENDNTLVQFVAASLQRFGKAE